MKDRLRGLPAKLRRLCCCPPPPAPAGVGATGGGGSGEVQVTWNPLPPPTNVAFYRVYRSKGNGTYWHLAVVLPSAVGLLVPGKVGVIDAPDYWPWPAGDDGTGTRCYTVTAVSANGLEGPMSGEACGTPT